ncbi:MULTISPECIES: LptF/LptG family permease [Spirosoma]|uniref:LptF/LptG family permease n=1 Tax=Spirosoma liriopis TaxID=2937440 RepID=A0ABT0HR00_9BACT|nr:MULTISPECIES: LptF/LptG family permease [Spirosoma]MCK8494410.1 LptF/LptG family permease [Spirosoma liriopis]UHG89421.1 LptF/LptG family permease [Spirosoma oryzicola]
MKLLDWYILKRFLQTYLFVVMVIVLVVVMIDYTEKVDNFHKNNAPASEILGSYYLNFIPYWANYISPLMVFIATVFLTSRLAARTEIIAILSSGVSFIRLLFPYVLGASILAVVTYFMVNYVIPKANKTRINFEIKYINDAFTYSRRNVHIKIAPDTYAYLESYNNQSNTGYRFTLERVEGNELKQKLTADHIEWDKKKKKWGVYDYKIRTINGLQETLTPGARLDTTLNLKPDDFGSDFNLYETLTRPELNRHIDLLVSRGSDGVETYLLEKYSRDTRPFAIIILTVIGVIMSARKSRRGVGWQVALGFFLAFTYLLFFMLAKGIAESGNLNPVVAVWLPNAIFTVVGVFLYNTIPR